MSWPNMERSASVAGNHGPELTSYEQSQSSSQLDLSHFSDSDPDDITPLPAARSYTPDILSGVYRGIRKLPSVKVSRKPSLLSLRSHTNSPNPGVSGGSGSSGPNTPAGPLSSFSAGARERRTSPSPPPSASKGEPPSSFRPPQYARHVSRPSDVDKPLPVPPPPQLSPINFTTPQYGPQTGLTTVAEQIVPNPAFIGFNMESGGHAAAGDGYAGSSFSSGVPPERNQYHRHMESSMTSQSGNLQNQNGDESNRDGLTPRSNGPPSAAPSPSPGQGRPNASATPVAGPSQGPSTHLSGLMCNVHRTTGREPHPLVGATTTILGDKLYVFGGRILSRSRPAPLTADLYELDLIRRHWTKLETSGDIPPPRYFHSMCSLGDTKLVCYGGMSPASVQAGNQDPVQQPGVTVMSDIHIYETLTKKWTYVPAQDPPQGRYAHCASILPSSASFSSHRAPLSSLQHNPSNGNPNEGRIGINIDGSGGAEMVVVGGQDGADRYIEQISVFNLRSLKWTSTQPLGKSCGAYRSVTAPMPPSVTSRIGKAHQSLSGQARFEGGISQEAREPGSSMLIYSNYNFLDVKLELQVRGADGALTERPMTGTYSPPGLRFPNGGIIDTYFIVSGTYLTSSKQEYALWALDLRSMTWSRIDAGAGVFSQGSWNRGVLWNRRNTFVILGNRKRSLVDDYNHRRINFSNVCMVELEAFGFYNNPRKTTPMSGFVSASSPYTAMGLSTARKAGYTAGGRFHSRASEELGEKALAMRELCDMDILCIGGERVAVNSRIVARRWGPYFVQLLREGTATQDGSDAMTLRSGSLSSNPLRASALTITPSSRLTTDSALSTGTTLAGSLETGPAAPFTLTGPGSMGDSSKSDGINPANINAAPTPRSLPPNSRPRCLYLPHTYLTVQALLHFLYTSSLPPPSSPLCTPQILCSLLQIARPYRVDGLLEAVVERLHALLDSRNAAAVFNATAMAAGGGRGIDGSLNPNFFVGSMDPVGSPTSTSDFSIPNSTANGSTSDLSGQVSSLGINTNVSRPARPPSDELSATTSVSGSEWSSEVGESERDAYVWSGELSSVIGLQKRGLRGLMDGRRMRERTGAGAGMSASGGPGYSGPQQQQQQQQQQPRLGLGIAGSMG